MPKAVPAPIATVALALILVLPTPAPAKTVKLGEGKPVAEITLPDTWSTEAADGSVESMSPDSKTYVAADIYAGTETAEAVKATRDFLVEQKIKVKPETKVQKAATIAGLPALEISWDATDEDGPTRFRILLVRMSAKKLALVTYWRSEAGETAHGAEVDAILSSLKPLESPRPDPGPSAPR